MLAFNRHHLRQKRHRSLKTLHKADFLIGHAQKQLNDRLNDIKREFERGLLIGTRFIDPALPENSKIKKPVVMDLVPSQSSYPSILGDEEFLPIKPASQDAILSLLTLHSVNDLPGALIQIRRALKPDGLFIAALLGGETLFEIRSIMQATEEDVYGGISPRIFPFADKPMMGSLLQRAGFALPVVDSDILKVSYQSGGDLWQDLKNMGESNIQRGRFKGLTGKMFFERLENKLSTIKNDAGRFEVSFEIIYLIGWAPHESQQKPLRPGSADQNLADILGTSEERI